MKQDVCILKKIVVFIIKYVSMHINYAYYYASIFYLNSDIFKMHLCKQL